MYDSDAMDASRKLKKAFSTVGVIDGATIRCSFSIAKRAFATSV
jgi:hypothetical protein